MSDPKQEIFDILYSDDLADKRVLDVGGGLNEIKNCKECVNVDLIYGLDWYDFDPSEGWDVIIANDLFPNVDQRLELFLEKYLPHCKEMRLSLTYFDTPKWYRAKRVDGDEILTMQAWSRDDVMLALANCLGDHVENLTGGIEYPGTFPNGRRVLLVWLKGGL